MSRQEYEQPIFLIQMFPASDVIKTSETEVNDNDIIGDFE